MMGDMGGVIVMTSISGLGSSQMSQILAQQIISAADATDNGSDGAISKTEFADVLKSVASSSSVNMDDLFAKIDINGDGSISLDELSLYLEETKPKQPPPPPPADILGLLLGQTNATTQSATGSTVNVAA